MKRPSWQEYFASVGAGNSPNAVELSSTIQPPGTEPPKPTQELYDQLRAQGMSKEQIRAKFGL